MILDLSGRSALVVGGGQGIGRATALALAEAGARVAVLDLDRSRAEAVAGEVSALGRESVALDADVTDAAAAKRAVHEADAAFEGLDIVNWFR